MTKNSMNLVHNQRNAKVANQQQTDIRQKADEMLRDIAFVLRMTMRVRDQMEADIETREPALI
jgi:hypothetical protein